jgi:hypothetical protein
MPVATCDAVRSAMCLSHASCNFAAIRAGDDEETNVKLVQTLENFVFVNDYSHKYYANEKDTACREISKKMDL